MAAIRSMLSGVKIWPSLISLSRRCVATIQPWECAATKITSAEWRSSIQPSSLSRCECTLDSTLDARSLYKCQRTHLSTLRSIVPSPSKGILVIFLKLKLCSSSNCSSAVQVMLTNLLLVDGSCVAHVNTACGPYGRQYSHRPLSFL